MRSSLDFPFGFHDHYLKSGIYEDLNRFYKAFENEFQGHLIKRKLEQEHVIEVFKNVYSEKEDNYRTLKFEDTIKFKIIPEINKTIEYIKQSCAQYIVADGKSLKGYYKYLNSKYKELNTFQAFNDFNFLHTYYKIILDFITELNIEIDENIVKLISPNDIIGNPCLKVKQKYKASFFEDLYEIAIHSDFNIIDSDEISQEVFKSFFIFHNTKEKLRFRVKNGIAVAFIEAIKPIFIKHSAKLVENSDKFRTNKNGYNFSQDNYNKSKGKINIDDKILIKKMCNEIKTLLDNN